LGYHSPSVGAWRSLVAHLHGVQGVASSNLVAPTNYFDADGTSVVPSVLPILNGEYQGDILGQDEQGFLAREIASRHRRQCT
jgi:hypothetical protein